MLRSDRFYLAVALVTAAAAATAAEGCGSSGTTAGAGGNTGSTSRGSGSTASSGSTSGTGGGGTGGASSCKGGDATVLAANKLYFGDGNNGEWKALGFNIDGIVSASGMPGAVCQVVKGGDPNKVHNNGDNGIDNSFGENILPTLLFADPTFVTDANASITSGNFTMMLKLECLGLHPMGDVDPLLTKLFGGTPLGGAPKFDGTDAWPVAPELLNDPKDVDSSKITFAKSSVKGQAFDSGKNQTFILSVPINTMSGSTVITLNVHAAEVKMNLSADRKSATGGIIGGVLNTEEFIGEVKKVGYLNNLCNSPIFTNIENLVRQASDIMDNGIQDPMQTCNGISIGIGFDMKPVTIAAMPGPATPVGKSCP